jgi:hypothetical protein
MELFVVSVRAMVAYIFELRMENITLQAMGRFSLQLVKM